MSGQQRDWRAGAGGPGRREAESRSSVFVAGLLAVTLLGILVGLVYWLLSGGTPTVGYMALPLSEHVDPVWPPVPFAEADADRLLKRFPGGEKAFNYQEAELFRRKLDSLKALGDRPLVLHIAGLAVVHDGRPYLLSSKAAPGAPDANWHALTDILDAWAACPARDKLLILDVIHPVARADRGILADTAAVAVHGTLKSRADEGKLPGLVLVSCLPGEFALADENFRAGALAGFLDEGLRGYADGHLDGGRDRWVKVRELHAYARDRLARWAYFTRGTTQTVALYGDGDFRLVAHDKVQEAETTAVIVPYPAWLADGWKLRDDWDAAGARTKAPHLLHRLNDALLRAEARVRAGVPDDKAERELAAVRTNLTPSWERFRVVEPPPPTNLLAKPAPTALLAKLEGWLATFDGKKKLADALGEMKPTRDDVVLAAWLRLADTALPRDQIVALCGEAVPPGSLPESSEAVFLFKLGELAGKRVFVAGDRTWPGPAALAAVRGERAALEAVAAASQAPEVFRWLKPRLDALEASRSAAETVLWTLGDDGLIGASTAASDVAGRYAALAKQANEIREDARKSADALRALTDAAAELPGLGAALIPTPAGGAIEQWTRAASAATELANLLDQPEQPPGFGDRLAGPGAVIRESLGSLRGVIKELAEREPDGKATPAVLATPRMTGKQRADWWARRQAWVSGKEKWLAENESTARATELPGAGDWAGPESDRAAARARMAVELHQLAGTPGTPAVAEVADVAVRRDPFAWSGLAARLLAATRPSGGPPVTGRASRVFGMSDAAAREAATVRKEFWAWMAERYEGEARLRGLARAPFYVKAAQESRAAAEIARTAAGP